VRRKEVAEVILGGAERDIADVELVVRHDADLSRAA
jgi:hypothetical protein